MRRGAAGTWAGAHPGWVERFETGSHTPAMSEWTFLTNHSHVLLCIFQNPQIRLSEIAERVGVKERTAFTIISDLVEAGYLSKVRSGRRNVYAVHPELHLRHPLERETEIRALLSIIHAGGQPGSPAEDAP